MDANNKRPHETNDDKKERYKKTHRECNKKYYELNKDNIKELRRIRYRKQMEDPNEKSKIRKYNREYMRNRIIKIKENKHKIKIRIKIISNQLYIVKYLTNGGVTVTV